MTRTKKQFGFRDETQKQCVEAVKQLYRICAICVDEEERKKEELALLQNTGIPINDKL